jgi:hypothetical protein
VISNIVVILSIVFAGAFFIAWLLRRDLRERIERPKHRFQDQLRQYDKKCHNPDTTEHSIDA